MCAIKSGRSLRIRLATKKDLPSLVELENICIKEEQFEKRWEYLLLKARSKVFVASTDGKIVGSIVILLKNHIANARIYILNVHPAYRRKGIGGFLIDAALRFLKEKGFNKVTIETGINNKAAQNLYFSKGFSVDRILEKYYKNGDDALHLVLLLKKTDQITATKNFMI